MGFLRINDSLLGGSMEGFRAFLNHQIRQKRIRHAWDASLRRILIGALDVALTFRDDAVQASVGWPLMEMTLQSGSAPVGLIGILRPSEPGDRLVSRARIR